MTTIDLLLQRWRIEKAKKFIQARARVLDIGCADGALFKELKHLQEGIGIDPDLREHKTLQNARLISGFFPDDIPSDIQFDVITLLAVMEHIPMATQQSLAQGCFNALNPGGILIVTVPSPSVDKLLHILKAFRLVHGMREEQHYGFDVNITPNLFESVGFDLKIRKRFQIGFNNLFVFARP